MNILPQAVRHLEKTASYVHWRAYLTLIHFLQRLTQAQILGYTLLTVLRVGRIGDIPLPSSSMMIKDDAVAFCTM